MPVGHRADMSTKLSSKEKLRHKAARERARRAALAKRAAYNARQPDAIREKAETLPFRVNT